MTEIERAKRLLEYDAWADLEMIRSLASVAATVLEQARQESPRPIQKLIAHIIGVKWNWLARIRCERPPMAIWPEYGELKRFDFFVHNLLGVEAPERNHGAASPVS